MKLQYKLVRCFDEDLWWKCYLRSKQARTYIIRKLNAFLFMRITAKNGGYIGSEVVMKGRPDLKHDLHGIHINRNTIIGKNLQICPNVVIGVRGGYSPTIGDNVYIGANAVIIGGIHIGNNVKIGAGTVVVEDVPDGATVVGEKAKIILRKE